MHVALVIDPERLLTDRAAFARLAVAFAAEGIRVTRIMPPAASGHEVERLLPVLAHDWDGSPLFRRARLGGLVSALEGDSPDVFVSMGARAFEAAAELAEDLESALIGTFATEDELAAAPLRRWSRQLDLVCTSTGPLAVRAGRTVPPELVSVIPVGVRAPGPGAIVPPSPQSVAIVGQARDDGAYRAIFTALADVAPALPELQVAIEFPPGHDPGLWRLAREMEISQFLNGVSSLESVRPLALACGVFAVADALHGTRPIVLEAMGAGRVVLAAEDPFADYLIDGVTAVMPEARDAASWTRALTHALLDPSAAAVGAEAAARTASRFGSAHCAEQLIDACVRAVRGPVIPFAAPGTRNTP